MIFVSKPTPIRFRRKAWLKRKFREIESATDTKSRSALIDELAAIPSYVTDWLVLYSRGKCWYCERKLTRSELVIEHFRPKRRITNVPNHPGYYWLSANFKNFRIACKNCNCRWTNPDGVVAGKGNYFPLLNEVSRVSSRNSDLRSEKPLLYDPLCQADCDGLLFLDDGSCEPASKDYVEVNRAFSSITLYNLNNPHLVDSRKQLWGDLTFKMELALVIKNSDPTLFTKVVNDFRAKCKGHAEYAGLARCAVQKINMVMGNCI